MTKAELIAINEDLRRRLEQKEVQLSGCMVAAEGYIFGKHLVKQGEYGWSASYAAVVNLRRKYEDALKQNGKK